MNKEEILNRYRRRGRDYSWIIYQPINLPGYEETLDFAGRNCFDRIGGIRAALKMRFGDKKLRIIDWGCNLGFFAFELAKDGHRVIGVDRNQKFIDVCNFLSDNHEFPIRPGFYKGALEVDAIENFGEFDVAICLSVFHHIKRRKELMLRFSDLFKCAFVEMDGPKFGYNELFSFYFEINEVAETNDPYGRGKRKRKTFECCNLSEGNSYSSLKRYDILAGRGVFKKVSVDGVVSVVKKEVAEFSHCWVKTNLLHEIEMYEQFCDLGLFPRLLDFSRGGERFLELEFLESFGSLKEEEIRRLFTVLSKYGLFIVDFRVDSLIQGVNGVKVVDLETMFEFDDLRKMGSLLKGRKRAPFRSYDEQLNYLLNRVKRNERR